MVCSLATLVVVLADETALKRFETVADGTTSTPRPPGATVGGLEAADARRQRYPAGLTEAEVQVLRRLAAGLKTQAIAADLVVAVSTVDRHITHIYDKIGERGRAAAAAFALKHGLL